MASKIIKGKEDPMDKTQVLQHLKASLADIPVLPGEEQFFFNEETLMRYLKARDFDLEESEKLLKTSIEWRRANQPLSMDCKWCHEKPGYHCMRQVGFDELGRPVIYSCFAQIHTTKNTVEDSVAHCVYLIENAQKLMPPGVTQWVWIIDCTGVTLPACNPRLGYECTQIMSNHYPERLGMVVCLNHSPVFQGVWQAIKVFLHPNTSSKVKLVRSKDKIKELFNKYFSIELTKWLEDEIRLNKARHLAQSQRNFWMPPCKSEEHDPRGSPSFVERFINPLVDKLKRGENLADSEYWPHPNIIDFYRDEERMATMMNGVSISSSTSAASLPSLDESEKSDNEQTIEIPPEYQIVKQ